MVKQNVEKLVQRSDKPTLSLKELAQRSDYASVIVTTYEEYRQVVFLLHLYRKTLGGGEKYLSLLQFRTFRERLARDSRGILFSTDGRWGTPCGSGNYTRNSVNFEDYSWEVSSIENNS